MAFPCQQLFLQERFSDADLSIRVCEVPALDDMAEDAPAAQPARELSRHPVHQLVLCANYEFFEAQLERWQDSNTPAKEHTPAAKATSSRKPAKRARTSKKAAKAAAADDDDHADDDTAAQKDSPAAAAAARPLFVITVDEEEHAPSVVAMMAAMYGADNQLEQLTHEQLVQMVLYGDRLQIGAASAAGMKLLLRAAQAKGGLSAAAQQLLGDLPSWPSCMVPLLPHLVSRVEYTEGSLTAASKQAQHLLVQGLGDLQAVWADAQLQSVLMQLPLPAMQLLLASDNLQVNSEDDVVFVAEQWVSENRHARLISDRKQQAAALGQLVRYSQLSPFQQIAQATRSDTTCAWYLFNQRRGQLVSLLPLLRLWNSGAAVSLEELASNAPGAPRAWFAEARAGQQEAADLFIEWHIDVEQLAAACRKAKRTELEQSLRSGVAGPYAGLRWQALIQCNCKEGGVVVLAGVRCHGQMPGAWAAISTTCEAGAEGALSEEKVYNLLMSPGQTTTFSDWCGVGVMKGDGWDEEAWAADSLPTTGQMLLRLTLSVA